MHFRQVLPEGKARSGYAAADAIGQNWRVLRSQRQTPEFYNRMWETILGGHVWHGTEAAERLKKLGPLERLAVWITAHDKRRTWHYLSIFDRTEREHPRAAAFVW